MNYRRYISLTDCPFIGLSMSQFKIIKLITIIITLLIANLNAKPFKSHRCLDWRFGGWSPMLYSLQPNVSPPIYHRQPSQQTTEIQHLSKQNSANYVKKLKPSIPSWLPYYQMNNEAGQSQNTGQAKVIRYNVRKPSKYATKYPKYPQYLPTTVLHLKPVKPNNQQSNKNYPQSTSYQSNKMQVYSVPIKSSNYEIKNIYSQPIIYEQLDYHLSNHQFNKYPNVETNYPQQQISMNYPMPQIINNYPQPQQINYPQQQMKYPQKQQQNSQQQSYKPINKKPGKPKKTTVAAYIPVVQVPAIEHIKPNNKVRLNHPTLDVKKPTNYDEKVIEEHIYQVPNQMLHEIKHEIYNQPKPIKTVYTMPAIVQKLPTPMIKQPAVSQYLPEAPKRPISQAVSYIHQSFGSHYVREAPKPQYVPETRKPQYMPEAPKPQYVPETRKPQYMPEAPKPQIAYEIENYRQPDVYEIPYQNKYQMDNVAKPEDSGLFKPLLDQTRQANRYPKIGVVPYKDNDPENLNVIHLIANQKILPTIVPITSIHTSNDGSYPIRNNEGEMPIMEKQISSYSEKPLDYHENKPQYGPVKSSEYEQDMKIEQEKAGYVDDERVILEQLNVKQPEQSNADSYKEQPPQYVIHQTYSPISSIKEISLPSPPETNNNYQPMNNNYQLVNKNQPMIDQIEQIKNEDYSNQQEVKGANEYGQQEVKGANEYGQQEVKGSNEYIQQEVKGANEYSQQEIKTPDYSIKTSNYPVQQQEDVKSNDYSPIEQIKEQPITQIQQMTTEYIKQEEPKTEITQQQTDIYSGNNQAQTEDSNHEQAPVQKNSYPDQNYQVKGAVVEEYGRRVPTINYQYVKPNDVPSYTFDQLQNNDQTPYQSNEQNFNQEQQKNYYQKEQQVERQKSVQDTSSKEQLSEEQANIAAYEEARKSILQDSLQTTIYGQPQSISYHSQSSSSYQPSSYAQEQSTYQVQPVTYQQTTSYQPPLSTAYDTSSKDSKSTNDYTDDYSNSYEANAYKTEPVKIVEEVRIDKVYNLPSNDKVVVSGSTNQQNNAQYQREQNNAQYQKEKNNNQYQREQDNGQYKSEILTSEEQTKKNYETLPETKSEEDERPIKQLLNDAKTKKNGQKYGYGQRLVYVKSPKFKNLRTINGNTYLGDTLLYSASNRSNSTIRRIKQQKETGKSRTISQSASNIKSEIKPESESIKSEAIKSESIFESVKNNTTTSTPVEITTSNTTSNKSTDDGEKIVNYVKPISRSELRNLRIKKLRKDMNEQLASSASEQIETKLRPDVIDLTDLNADDLMDNIKEADDDLEASGSQLFHAYYGPPNHQPEPGYVRLTVQQFKEIFKDAEIHVLKTDQNQQLSSTTDSSINSSILNSNLSSTTPTAQ